MPNRSLYERIDQLPTARFVGKSDRVFNRHRGGKIRTISRVTINTLQILRDVYTPGVARVCLAIKADPRKIHDYTAIDNTVAIITNGTADPRSRRHRRGGGPAGHGRQGRAVRGAGRTSAVCPSC